MLKKITAVILRIIGLALILGALANINPSSNGGFISLMLSLALGGWIIVNPFSGGLVYLYIITISLSLFAPTLLIALGLVQIFGKGSWLIILSIPAGVYLGWKLLNTDVINRVFDHLSEGATKLDKGSANSE